MGRHKRKHAKRAVASETTSPFPEELLTSPLSAVPTIADPEILSLLMSYQSDFSIIGKFSTLLGSVTPHKHSEVQVLKETISQAIKDIYSESLSVFTMDMRRIRCGEFFFTDKVMFEDFRMLKVALNSLLELDDSKEVYHLTFVQVNWFTDQLIRSIRGLEGCGSSVIMAAVTRAWNVTKAAATRLNTFLFHLFKTEKAESDFSCMILNKQILIEKLRKEPIIIALNEKTDKWNDSDEYDTDVYEGMSIDEIASEIEEPTPKQAREFDRLCDEFRFKLENEPTPPHKVPVRFSQQWLQQVEDEVRANYEQAFGDWSVE